MVFSKLSFKRTTFIIYMVKGVKNLQITPFNYYKRSSLVLFFQRRGLFVNAQHVSIIPRKRSQYYSIPKPNVIPKDSRLVVQSILHFNMVSLGPWGNMFGPLELIRSIHDLLHGSWNNFPNFYGDERNISMSMLLLFILNAMFLVYNKYEAILIKIFIRILQVVVVDWCNALLKNPR